MSISKLQQANLDLRAAREELAMVEHGADDTAAQQRYEAALATYNAAKTEFCERSSAEYRSESR